MIELTLASDANEIDVDGLIDRSTGIQYLGKATRNTDGRWQCLAIVGEALCRVEITVTPLVHIGNDPGDEDDQLARAVRRDRDVKRPSAR